MEVGRESQVWDVSWRQRQQTLGIDSTQGGGESEASNKTPMSFDLTWKDGLSLTEMGKLTSRVG